MQEIYQSILVALQITYEQVQNFNSSLSTTISIIAATFIAIGLFPSAKYKGASIALMYLLRFFFALLLSPIVLIVVTFMIELINSRAYYTTGLTVLAVAVIYGVHKGVKT